MNISLFASYAQRMQGGKGFFPQSQQQELTLLLSLCRQLVSRNSIAMGSAKPRFGQALDSSQSSPAFAFFLGASQDSCFGQMGTSKAVVFGLLAFHNQSCQRPEKAEKPRVRTDDREGGEAAGDCSGGDAESSGASACGPSGGAGAASGASGSCGAEGPSGSAGSSGSCGGSGDSGASGGSGDGGGHGGGDASGDSDGAGPR